MDGFQDINTVLNTDNNKKIYLFVCSGNTCRSPMCEAVFNKKYSDSYQIGASAGLGPSGNLISSNAVMALKAGGILPFSDDNFENHLSKQIDEQIISDAFKVICITGSIYNLLIHMFPESKDKITSFKHDVFDPYGGDENTYSYCLSIIERELELLFGENND